MTEKAARSNYLATRGILFKMQEACPVSCDTYISLNDEQDIVLLWKWRVVKQSMIFQLAIRPEQAPFIYEEIERAKHYIRGKCDE